MPTAQPSLDQIDPARAWEPWRPTDRDPWGRKWAGHLFRRAAFGASDAELRQAEKDGPAATLDRLLSGAPDAAARYDFLEVEGERVTRENDPFKLRAWWLYCMLYSPHPLREKLTLFWHNHFATSIAKVDRTRLMFLQNRTLRRHALGMFGPFLLDMSKDPAMLVWLDSNNNIKGRPNENYAREVMELFSLGVGNYTEKDVQEAARAFTGWHTDGKVFDFNARFHDADTKTVLGQTGPWDGGDVIPILLRQPAAGRFLARKLYRFLVSETQEPPDRLLEPLAEQFRKTDYDVSAVVRTILASRHFFSEHAFRQRVKSPVEFVVGAVRATVSGEVAPRALVGRLELMGQNLFAPPNVKGWPGGQAWLNTSSVLARQNFAQALAMGTLWGNVSRPASTLEELRRQQLEEEQARAVAASRRARGKPVAPEEPAPPEALDPARLTRAAKVAKPEEVVSVLLDAYLPGGVRPSAREKLVAFAAEGKPQGPALDRRAREAVHAILSMPEYQLA
jgi:uncharacterized protein (DUF1800 family)